MASHSKHSFLSKKKQFHISNRPCRIIGSRYNKNNNKNRPVRGMDYADNLDRNWGEEIVRRYGKWERERDRWRQKEREREIHRETETRQWERGREIQRKTYRERQTVNTENISLSDIRRLRQIQREREREIERERKTEKQKDRGEERKERAR